MQSGAPSVLVEFLQWTITLLLQGTRFAFQGRKYRYHHAMYNKTWTNERAVEVPIIWRWVEEFKGRRILEVGNVLSYYFETNHDVLDKYEILDGVINEDATQFQARKKYDLIVSISTLEHVGVDDDEKRPEKALEAISNLIRNLKPDGEFLATFPLGYNSALDNAFFEGTLPFTEYYYLKRASMFNRWREISREEIDRESTIIVIARRRVEG